MNSELKDELVQHRKKDVERRKDLEKAYLQNLNTEVAEVLAHLKKTSQKDYEDFCRSLLNSIKGGE